MPTDKPGIPAMPVYAWWLRVDYSKHEYCGPATSGAPQKGWRHLESSPVRGLVGLFQKFSPPVVRFDGQRFALFGHDVGPFVPHICAPPDNTLLSVTLMKSKCKWPFSATRGKFGKRVPCVFQQLIIPYVHCHERGKQEKQEKELSDAPAAQPSKSVEAPKTTAKSQVPGFGLVMIPTGPQTVDWRLGFRDFALGVANLLADVGFDYVWKRYHVLHGKSPLQQSVARRLGGWMKEGSTAARALIKAGVEKAVKDYAKGLASSAEVRAPFKIAKLDLNTGKVTIWKREVGDIGWKISDILPFDYPGWDPLLKPGNRVLDELVGEVMHAG